MEKDSADEFRELLSRPPQEPVDYKVVYVGIPGSKNIPPSFIGAAAPYRPKSVKIVSIPIIKDPEVNDGYYGWYMGAWIQAYKRPKSGNPAGMRLPESDWEMDLPEKKPFRKLSGPVFTRANSDQT